MSDASWAPGWGGCSAIETPEAVFESLCELISEQWLDGIREHACEDPNYLDNIHPRLLEAVAKAISKSKPKR